MTDDVLQIEHPEPGMAVLTLNRPQRLNALDGPLVDALMSALDDLDAAWPETKVIVLRGAGRAFCPGVDLKWLQSGVLADDAATNAFLDRLGELVTRLENTRQVVIGAVHGFAVAGGLELLLGCDLIVVATDAQIGDDHIRRNLVPGGGDSQRLPRRVGFFRGMYLLLTGNRLTGREAVDWGLACACAEPEDLDETVLDLARQLAGRDAGALHTVKSMVRRGAELPLQEGLSLELYLRLRYRDESDSMAQGVSGFAAPDRR